MITNFQEIVTQYNAGILDAITARSEAQNFLGGDDDQQVRRFIEILLIQINAEWDDQA